MSISKYLKVVSFSMLGAVGAERVSAHESHSGRADSHAPIGVMGDHTHKAGEFMVSYRHMEMSMSGNRQGSSKISGDDIAMTIENRFFGMPNMPPTLRIVPQEMTTKMDMFGVMYAPSDRFTLMAMLNVIDREMTLSTYMGGMGNNIRGDFETSTSGLGDTKVAALISLHDSNTHKVHLNLGLSLPTGDIKQEGQILTPMGAEPTVRLPYAMQLGSGTYDFEPGITYVGYASSTSWGLQYKAIIRSGENDEGYQLGDQHAVTAWGQYLFSPEWSTSLRAKVRTLDTIDGQDQRIMGPVQTADPNNYGGDYAELGLGVNYYGQSGFLNKQRFAFEFLLPVHQDVNGVQMSMENMLVFGYQYAF